MRRSGSIGYYHQHTLSTLYGNDPNHSEPLERQMVGETDGKRAEREGGMEWGGGGGTKERRRRSEGGKKQNDR